MREDRESATSIIETVQLYSEKQVAETIWVVSG